MSVVVKCIGIAKKLKRTFAKQIKARTPIYISPVRRFEQVKTAERICAMTFDDGPFALPPSHGGSDKSLTLTLLEILESYDAKGTFDIVGDTSENYPDQPGKVGTALWGGISYDHYPDINKDEFGGAKNCPDLIDRILEGGHELTNHTYVHVLYGKKPFVYGGREYLGDIKKVTDDLMRLHNLIRDKHGYEMLFSRPPHYVDTISRGLTSYDALALTDYQYMAASFDGAGWLPLSGGYEAEVEAMWKPIESLLNENPDALCGQIIFQKDGYNMARRTPVADGLPKQLEILKRHGYKVVNVRELIAHSPYSDLAPCDEGFETVQALEKAGYCVCFSDNYVKLNKPLTRGEFAMILYGKPTVSLRVDSIRNNTAPPCSDVPNKHPYSAAVRMAIDEGVFTRSARFLPEAPLNVNAVNAYLTKFGVESSTLSNFPSRLEVFKLLATLKGE